MQYTSDDIGVVVIGRNEGQRLKRCLQSIIKQAKIIVYVDSGSTDGSVEYAESLGVAVHKLDMRKSFSAGRARNEGFRLLNKIKKTINYIQFIDGDCELNQGWIIQAYEFLVKNRNCAIVAGRRKEKFPERSVYNLLCDLEWDTPIGEADACGGDFMIRKEAFQQVSGFNPSVIAGEEPEMCFRLKKKGWSIFRLDQLMTMHDAAIEEFSQWWNRAVRSGHAYAQGFMLYARENSGYCLKDTIKIWFWAFILPVSVMFLSLTFNWLFLLLLNAYLVQQVKIIINSNNRIGSVKKTIAYSVFTAISRIPQFIGQLLFAKRKIFDKKFTIIEYNK